MSHIKTYARVKPSQHQFEDVDVVDSDLLLRIPDPVQYYTSYVKGRAKVTHRFHFDKVFDQNVSQEELFNTVAVDIVDAFLNGYNGTIFAYGQTGTGKTYTVEGGSRRYNDRGLASRAVSRIYSALQNRSDEHVSVQVSFLEIYQEVGYDLLNTTAAGSSPVTPFPRVSVIEGPGRSCLIRNLTSHLAASEDVAQNLLLKGQANRTVAETPVNQRSSRSHAVFTISLTAQKTDSDIVVRSKLHLVDLAGSERVAKTGVDGQQLSEAKSINLSLHHLESVIIALQASAGSGERTVTPDDKGGTDGLSKECTTDQFFSPKHVPYRNSLLTMVLRDSLGGNCLTAMVATISLEWQNLGETISTCRFAQRVACIANNICRNEEIDDRSLVKILRKKIAELETEITFLKLNQESDGDLEKMSVKLSDEERRMCAEIIHGYMRGSVRDPVTAGITCPFKFRECMQILKAMIKGQKPTINQNNIVISEKPMLSETRGSRPSSCGSHRHASRTSHSPMRYMSATARHVRKSSSTTALNSGSVSAIKPQDSIRELYTEQKRRVKSAAPLHTTHKSSYQPTQGNKPEKTSLDHSDGPNKDTVQESTTCSDNLGLDELVWLARDLEQKGDTYGKQMKKISHMGYLESVGVDKESLRHEFKKEKHLHRKQASVCGKLAGVCKQLRVYHGKETAPSCVKNLEEKFGQHRKTDGSLNTRQVFEKLQTDQNQTSVTQFAETHLTQENLEAKEMATRQKLSHFRKLLANTAEEKDMDSIGLCEPRFAPPTYTSTPNNARKRADEMQRTRKLHQKATDELEDKETDTDLVYGLTVASNADVADNTTKPSINSSHAKSFTNDNFDQQNNIYNLWKDLQACENNMVYTPTEYVNQIEHQEVFYAHQMGLFSKTFESALQAMLERDNAKLFSHKNYDKYARISNSNGKHQSSTEKQFKVSHRQVPQAWTPEKKTLVNPYGLKPYCIPADTSAALTKDIEFGYSNCLTGEEEFWVEATLESDREISFMTKAKEQKTRIEKIRKAQLSAAVIQKAWRRYCSKRFSNKSS